MGVKLGKLFIADLVNGVPQTQRFIDIFNAFAFQPDTYSFNLTCWCAYRIFESKGIKDILLHLIFYQYTYKTTIGATQSGATINKSEVSNTLNPYSGSRFAEQKYNEALSDIEAIQWYIKCSDFANQYPEAQPVRFKAQYSSLL